MDKKTNTPGGERIMEKSNKYNNISIGNYWKQEGAFSLYVEPSFYLQLSLKLP